MAIPQRRMKVVSDGQVKAVTVRSNRQARTLGTYWNAVGEFMKGKRSNLNDFEGVHIGGRLLTTDTDVLEDLYLNGEIDIEDIYAEGAQ